MLIPIVRRTPRELAVVAFGIVAVVVAWRCTRDPDRTVTAIAYAAVTIAFAARLWPARALGVGTALGALAQTVRWTAAFPAGVQLLSLVALALLASGDLAERFDRAPSRLPPNPWARLPARDARRLRFTVYALGVLCSIVAQQYWLARFHDAGAAWSIELAVGLALCIALLAFGAAAALLPSFVLAVVVAVRTAPQAIGWSRPPVGLHGRLAAVLGLGAALAVVALASPYALRLLLQYRREAIRS